jgi:DNA uptake protein ComE-like DNA-binding protein
VLLVVLWVSIAAAALFFASTRGLVLEMRRQRTALDAVRAEAAAVAGVEKARFLLATLEPDPNLPDPLSALDPESFIGADLEGARYFLLKESPGEGLPELGLIDPSARINLNTATVEILEALPEMTADLAAAIIDFRDADDTPLPYGAESSAYLGFSSPYRARNADFESLGELLLVRGMTAELLYGEDRNLNALLDESECDGALSWPRDNADDVLDRGLYPLITVSSASLLNAPGDQWVNLNTAETSEIASALVGRISRFGIFQVMRAIYPQGPSGPRRTLSSMADLVRAFPDLATPERAADLAAILKYTGVSDDTVGRGLVNVNAASEDVLLALPEVDEGIATAIVAAREAGGHDFSTIAWLVEVPGMTPEVFTALMPLVSARSAYFNVDVAGASLDGKTSRRLWAAIDASTPDMRVISAGVVDCAGGALDFKALEEAGWTGK